MTPRLTPAELRRLCDDIRTMRAFAFLAAPPDQIMACERGGLATLLTMLVDTLSGQDAASLVADALERAPTSAELQAELPHAEMAVAHRAAGAAPAPKGLQ